MLILGYGVHSSLVERPLLTCNRALWRVHQATILTVCQSEAQLLHAVHLADFTRRLKRFTSINVHAWAHFPVCSWNSCTWARHIWPLGIVKLVFEDWRWHFLILLERILDILGVLGVHEPNVRLELRVLIPSVGVQVFGLSLPCVEGRAHRTT